MKRQSPRQLRGYLTEYLQGEKSRKTLLDWSLVVGKALSDASALVHVRGGTVVVWAESDSVRRELNKLEAQILSLVLGAGHRAGKLLVVDGERPDTAGNRSDSLVHDQLHLAPGEKHSEQERVRKACEGIEDDELRTILETFLSWKAPKGGDR